MASGQTLTIENGAIVYVADSQFIYVNGQLDCHRRLGGDRQERRLLRHHSDGIVVNNGGTMTDSGASIYRNGGSGYENSYLQVSTGGDLTATDSYFSLDNLYLNSGSSDQLTANVLVTQLQVNSGAFINITSNDFSNATVVASGTSTATIDLDNNYWGTTNPTQDRRPRSRTTQTNSNLPTVSYNPF